MPDPNPAAGGGQPAGAQNTETNAGAGGQGGAQPGAGGTNPTSGQTFTQTDLERILGERLAREREKFKDYEDLKKKAAEFDKLQEAQKSDLQKAQEAAKKAEEEKQRALAMANERLLKAEVKAIAVELGFVDADAAYALMDRAAVKVKDDGTVEGVKAALEALLKAKPYLKGAAKPGNIGTGTNPGAGNAGQSSMNTFIRRAAGRV